MFTQEFIQGLKQSNVSVDNEKTKANVYRIWKLADKTQRERILDMADVVTATIARAYKTGSISCKLIVPFSTVMAVNPYYLTGESDNPDRYSLGILKKFLSERGYQKQLDELDKNSEKSIVRVVRKPKEAESAAEDVKAIETESVDSTATVETPQDAETAMIDISAEEAHVLLDALFIRARVNKNCAGIAEKVKSLLIS